MLKIITASTAALNLIMLAIVPEGKISVVDPIFFGAYARVSGSFYNRSSAETFAIKTHDLFSTAAALNPIIELEQKRIKNV